MTRRDLVAASLGAMALVASVVLGELLAPVWCERWLRKGGI